MTRRSFESTDGVRRLINSKLEPPDSLVKLVARPQLIEMLDRCCDGRVTPISAPAGYGKTTLVSQWLDAGPSRPVAWFSLDRLDNDLERFVRYVIAALARVEEHCFSRTEEMLTARMLPPPQVLAESMVLEIERSRRRTTLVLDDYGIIRTLAIHEFIDALVSRLPAPLHLVVLTRIDPPLPLSLWRSRYWLQELRAADLRCSRDETKAFLNSAKKLELSDEGIDALHRKTEGWITGLRLALLSLDGSPDPEEGVRAFSASERLVTDYLIEEVLARQPPEIREFLAITSVLERFSLELCDVLLARADTGSAGQGRALLERLYHQNLFLLTLGSAHGWYRYHHLFRQLLLERFGELTTAVSKAGILHGAGDWFCANGWIEDGLTCFLAAGDLDAAEDVIGSHLHDAIIQDRHGEPWRAGSACSLPAQSGRDFRSSSPRGTPRRCRANTRVWGILSTRSMHSAGTRRVRDSSDGGVSFRTTWSASEPRFPFGMAIWNGLASTLPGCSIESPSFQATSGRC
jgi:LuxR family transcriptional regulator, maltose regulon positive regulatory protein